MLISKMLFLMGLLIIVSVLSFAQQKDSLPLGKTDSLPAAILKRVKNEQKKVGGQLKKDMQFSGTLQEYNPKTQAKKIINPFLTAKNSIAGQLTEKTKLFQGGNFFKAGEFTADVNYIYFHDTSGVALGIFRQSSGMFGYNASYSMTLKSIPFNMSIRENNGINTINYTPFTNFYNFHFDREKYLSSLRAQVLANIKPESVTASITNRINSIKQKYSQTLDREIADLQKEYTKETKSIIRIPQGTTDLDVKDVSSLHNKIIPEQEVEIYKKHLEKYQQLLKNSNGKHAQNDSAYQNSVAGIKKYKTLEKIYSRIIAMKQKFDENGTVKQLRSHLPFTPGHFNAFLKNPANLQKVLEEQTDMSGLQRLFSYVKNFDVGQKAVQSGDLNMQNTINTGVNAEIQNKKIDAGFIAGKNNTVNNWMQAGLTNIAPMQYASLVGIKLGSGNIIPSGESLSINMFNTKTVSPYDNGIGTLPSVNQKSMVFTLHSGFSIAAKHDFSIDFSKSFSAVQSNYVADSSVQKGLPANNMFATSISPSFAGKIDYSGELFHTKLKITLKKVGLGYNNPGNILLRRGESEIAVSGSRDVIPKLFTLKLDVDYKKQIYDPAARFSFKTLSGKMQTSYKINKTSKIRLTYQYSGYQTSFYGIAPSKGFNSRLQIDGNYKFVFLKKKITSNVTLSRIATQLPALNAPMYNVSSISLMHSSSTQIDKGILTLYVFYNKSNNDSYYFNSSMATTEMNYSFAAAKKLNLNTALGYYYTGGWNKQIGIKEGFSTTIKENLSINGEISYKKAVKIYQAELSNQLFLNVGLHYHFK